LVTHSMWGSCFFSTPVMLFCSTASCSVFCTCLRRWQFCHARPHGPHARGTGHKSGRACATRPARWRGGRACRKCRFPKDFSCP
jgi:hypothetical protein